MIATTLASAARPLWRLLEHYKIDPAFVFREAGLDPALMDNPRERYRAERRVASWAKAAELIDDPCFGLKLAEFSSPTDLHALGYAFLASSTLRTGLARISRYNQIVNDVVGFELTDDGETVSFTLRTDSPLFLPPAAPAEDGALAVIARICRDAYGEELNPVEVRIQHSAPTCSGNYDSLFRCPVIFESEATAICFARADVDHPLPAANRELARANDQILTDFLGKLHKDDLVTRVKKAIADELPSGNPNDDVIAKHVFLSPRTLHRKLSALGSNYSQLLEIVRRELAEQYVSDPSLSFSEISFLLGFSEQSAFSRAFKRWTGQTPSAARDTAAA